MHPRFAILRIRANTVSVCCDTASLDQGHRQAQLSAKVFLLASHFAAIALMIVSRQMQNAMQREDFNLFWKRMSQAPGVLGGDFGRDGHIAGKIMHRAWLRGKRQHVGRLIFAAVAFVQNAEGAVGRDQRRDFATESDSPPGATEKAVECGLVESGHAFLENYHPDN